MYRGFLNAHFPDVEFLGHVEDLEPEYSQASLVINPIWIGTGLKIKTIEALARRKPLVTTQKGTEGLGEECENACAVSAGEEDFSDKVVSLLTHPDERERLIAAADTFARTHLQTSAVYKELLDYLEAAQ